MSMFRSAFAEMDKNEDGKVTLEEFKTACLGREEFSKLLAIKVIDIFVEDEWEKIVAGQNKCNIRN